MALFANFLAPYGGDQRFIEYLYAPPQGLHFDAQIGLYVIRLGQRNLTSKHCCTTYMPDPKRKIPIQFFVHDKPYKLLGCIETDVHLFGIERQGRGRLPAWAPTARAATCSRAS